MSNLTIHPDHNSVINLGEERQVQINLSKLKYNIICVTGSGGGESGPGCLYTFLKHYEKYVNLTNVTVIDTNIPGRTLDRLVERFISSVTTIYNNTSTVPFVFIGWSMGVSIIIQAIKHNSWLQHLTKSIILISSQTHNATEIKNFNFNYELLVVHGDADKVLSYSCGETLYKIAKTENKYLVLIKGADHTMFSVKHSRTLIDVVVDYLNNIMYGSNKSKLFIMGNGTYSV